MTMPKFNFSKATFTSEAALQEATGKKSGGKESKVMRPGRHEVTISAINELGAAAKDPSWYKFSLILTGTGGKEIRDLIMVPTTDVVYGADKTMFPYNKLKNLLGALGVSLTVDNLGESLNATFGDLASLVGKNLAIEVGYQKSHVRFLRNDIGEMTGVRIVNGRTKQDLVDASGVVLTFPDIAAAEAHVQANNIPYDAFPSVLSYVASSTPNGKKDSNW